MNPLDDLERMHSFAGIGRMAVGVYQGALEEADGDVTVAFRATVAVLAAILYGATGNGEA